MLEDCLSTVTKWMEIPILTTGGGEFDLVLQSKNSQMFPEVFLYFFLYSILVSRLCTVNVTNYSCGLSWGLFWLTVYLPLFYSNVYIGMGEFL